MKVSEYVDIDSFIEGHLMEVITKNEDSWQGSMYFYLPAGGKLTYGPVWDMDITFGISYRSSDKLSTQLFDKFIIYNTFFKRMMKIPEFEEMYKSRFFELYDGLEAFIDNTIDEVSAEYHDELANEYEFRKDWTRYGNTELVNADGFDAQIDYMKKWTEERLQVLYNEYSA